MRTSVISIGLIALVISMGASGCSGKQGLVGLWQTETVRISPTGDTNVIVEAYQTLEFLKDGSFKRTDVIRRKDGKEVAIPIGRAYTIVDTNHVHLEIAPNSMWGERKIPETVPFNISCDQLERASFFPSAGSEFKKYRRVR